MAKKSDIKFDRKGIFFYFVVYLYFHGRVHLSELREVAPVLRNWLGGTGDNTVKYVVYQLKTMGAVHTEEEDIELTKWCREKIAKKVNGAKSMKEFMRGESARFADAVRVMVEKGKEEVRKGKNWWGF